jgi:hypothetical protein
MRRIANWLLALPCRIPTFTVNWYAGPHCFSGWRSVLNTRDDWVVSVLGTFAVLVDGTLPGLLPI